MQFSCPIALSIHSTLPLHTGNRGLEQIEVIISRLGLRPESVLPGTYSRATVPVVPPSLYTVFEDNLLYSNDSDKLEKLSILSDVFEYSL
jgi:hypothetical protein